MIKNRQDLHNELYKTCVVAGEQVYAPNRANVGDPKICFTYRASRRVKATTTPARAACCGLSGAIFAYVANKPINHYRHVRSQRMVRPILQHYIRLKS